MKDLYVSNHARQRIKERCGVSKKKAERICQMAVERGTERENTKGQLRKWLDHKHSKGQTIMVWGDKAYFISKEGVLITTIQIPSSITKNIKKYLVSPA